MAKLRAATFVSITALVLAAAACGLPATVVAQPAVSASVAGPRTPQALFARFYKASTRAARAAGHTLNFSTASDADPQTAEAFADAADAAADAVVALAAAADGHQLLAHIDTVRVSRGIDAGVNVSAGAVTLVIDPAEGPAGIPSARSIERAIRGGAGVGG